MSDLWRFTGEQPAGYLLVIVAVICALGFVLLVIESRRPPTRRGWDTRCSDRWRDEHREGGR